MTPVSVCLMAVAMIAASKPGAKEGRVDAPSAKESTEPPEVKYIGPSETKVTRPPLHIGLGATAKIGLLVPTNSLHTTFVVGLEVRERFPFLKRMLGMSLELAYFRPTLTGGGVDPTVNGAYSYDVAARALQLAVDGMFFVPASLPIDIYFGVGYSAFFYVTTATAFGASSSEIETRHGLRLRAGVLWPFGKLIHAAPLYAAAELLYHYASFAFLITGPANAGAFVANLSVGFEL